jgi:alpha-tubulin suppressor-like RCC1 family protein
MVNLMQNNFDFNALVSALPIRKKLKKVEPIDHVVVKIDMMPWHDGTVTELASLRNKIILDIASGQNHCVLLTNENGGTVYTCGFGFNGRLGQQTEHDVPIANPQPISNLHNIIAICAGSDFTLLLQHDEKNRVIVFGSNTKDQLLLKTQKANVLLPTIVEWLLTVPANPIMIAAGYAHSIVVVSTDSHDEILSFGWNEAGQLGRESGDGVSDTVVPFFSHLKQRIQQIVCGDHHTIVHTKTGGLYAMGRCQYGQLGISKSYCLVVQEPTKITFNKPVSSISAGFAHSLFLSHGELYATGQSSFGQLGLVSTKTVTYPVRVPCLKKEKSWKKEYNGIKQVAAGDRFSVLLTNDGRLIRLEEQDNSVQHVIRVPSLSLLIQRISVYGTHLYVYATSYAVTRFHSFVYTRDFCDLIIK